MTGDFAAAGAATATGVGAWSVALSHVSGQGSRAVVSPSAATATVAATPYVAPVGGLTRQETGTF